MAIQCLVGEEQNFVADPMLNEKPMQFSEHRANMVKLAHFRYNPGCIILAALQSVDVGLFLHILGCYSNPGEMLRWH